MSDMIVSLDTFLENVEVVSSNGETFFSALEKLISTSSQAVDYHVHRLFLINSIGVLEVDRQGRKFFDIELKNSEGDIISHIDTSMDSKLLIGPHTHDIRKRIVMCNSSYSPVRIRIFVNDSDRVYVSYRVIVLSGDLKNQLMAVPILVCDNISYANGSC